MLTTAFSFAQRGKSENGGKRQEQMEKRTSYTPQQMADIQTKKMTLKLDLNESQQTKVHTLLLAKATDMKAKKAVKKDRNAMSDQEKYDAKMARLDSQIEMKAQMKSILSTEQYAKFENGKKRRNMKKNPHHSKMKK